MQNTIDLLTWVIGMGAIWLIWSKGMKPLLLDALRESLFEARFQLFQLGMDGELAFDDPAYRSVEIVINALIRYGHRITFLSYVVSKREQERDETGRGYLDLSETIAAAAIRSNPKVGSDLGSILLRVRQATFRYMALTSPILLLGIPFVAAAKLLGLGRDEKVKAEVGSVIEREAYRVEIGMHAKSNLIEPLTI